MADLQALADQLFAGKQEEVKKLTQQAIDEGVSPKEILTNGLIKGMEKVGMKFKNNEIYVPEVLIAARAMKAGMGLLKPLLAAAGHEPIAKICLGTVRGDLHDIGKNLVVMMMEGAGFDVVDMGIDVKPEQFVEAAKTHNPQLIGMSALLTTTMPAMKDTIDSLKAAGLTNVKTIVGGAPLTQKYADEIGASGYAPDAASAVDTAKQLLGLA
ncbi:MAG TPA: corrinoid protein [bacterium]|nr:corrinoid protein [bacterium]